MLRNKVVIEGYSDHALNVMEWNRDLRQPVFGLRKVVTDLFTFYVIRWKKYLIPHCRILIRMPYIYVYMYYIYKYNAHIANLNKTHPYGNIRH